MHSRRPTMMSSRGIVAAAHPLAAQAGAAILASGGNAFDAAAATAAALNVAEPFMSGLGGLGLATMWVAAERRVRVLDFVTTIPSEFPVDRFQTRLELEKGAISVMAPGNLAGWCELVRAYGRLSLPEIFQPAIKIAEAGVPLAEFGIEEFNSRREVFVRSPELHGPWAENYNSTGKDVTLGTVIRQPNLAATLRAIADAGPEYLYAGPLGERVIAHLKSLGGTLTMADLAAVKPVWREPMVANYLGTSIHIPPPPCEGFQFLLALRILEGFDLPKLQRNGADHLDLVYRAVRLAAGVRISHNNPAPDLLARIMSDEFVERLRRRVGDGAPISGPTEQWMAEASPGEDPGHTTSFSIGDDEGNLVCVTQSLGSAFGSGVVVPGTGVCLNNFLYWSDVQPGSRNRAKPGDSLPMCMSPSISTREGMPVLALGTPGSYGILQTQVQAIVQHLAYQLPLQQAIDEPRARLWDGEKVEIENRLPAAVFDALRQRGHDVAISEHEWTFKVGGMQAVGRNPQTEVLTGAADPRRDGCVAVL